MNRKQKPINIKVYKSEGKSEYTVVIKNEVYVMDDQPLMPNGVNQYVCSKDQLVLDKKDKVVKIHSLPKDVIEAILRRLKDEGN